MASSLLPRLQTTSSDCLLPSVTSNIFSHVNYPSIYTWNAIISAEAKLGKREEALHLYRTLLHEGFWPDKYTFLGILGSLAGGNDADSTIYVHNHIVKSGLDLDVVVGNALVDSYVKCGSLDEGENVFYSMPLKDVVTWGAIISGYVQCGQSDFAFGLFEEMQQNALVPDDFVLSCLLKACSSKGDLDNGKLIHDNVVKFGFNDDLVVGNALVDMYSKCGSLLDGRHTFDELSVRDVVSWNAMIGGYAEYRDCIPAFALLSKMQHEGARPNRVTFATILKACGIVGALKQGRLIHSKITTQGIVVDLVLEVALVDMYAKCGSFGEAYQVLTQFPKCDVQPWNALIGGCADHAKHILAGEYIDEMTHKGVQPNCRTFNSVLAACSHAGQVEDGHRHFQNMVNIHGIVPDFEHLNCMMDLLGRVGCLHEADELMHTGPKHPCPMGLRSLLASCRTHGENKLGRACYGHAADSLLENASGFMLMSSIHADSCNWENVEEMQELRKHAGAWKKPGMAWMELHDTVHEFVVGEKGHVQNETKLVNLNRYIKGKGHVPQVDTIVEAVVLR